MRNKILITLTVVIVLVALGGGAYYYKYFRGIGPAINNPPQDIVKLGENKTGLPLNVATGFTISVFAKDLPGARVIKEDTFGNFWVSQTSQGIISLIEIDKESGKVVDQGTVFENLKNPHGLAFDPNNPFSLYIAEENRIIRVPTYSEYDVVKIIDLPSGGRHTTRTIGFGPDGRLYISIGSSCDVCVEKDERRAKIFSLNKNGFDFKEFARGLRNAVFLVWHPLTGKMWVTEMGRDFLGDNLPPDEINIVEEGRNYGWPICYGKNVHDDVFDKNVYFRNPCTEPFEAPSYIDIPAHSAPLGLAFIPKDSKWPKDYWNNLLVAYHGSWNRSVPTGYKIVRYKFDEQEKYLSVEDFITGWLTAEGALGRPVDLLAKPDGTLYITDDKIGVIYKVVAP